MIQGAAKPSPGASFSERVEVLLTAPLVCKGLTLSSHARKFPSGEILWNIIRGKGTSQTHVFIEGSVFFLLCFCLFFGVFFN